MLQAMSRPPNVVQTNELPWEEDGAEAPFGTLCRELHDRVRLEDLGLHLESVDPGRRTCPLHAHLLEEEVFYVLEGTLTVLERTADGRRYTYTIGPGELVAYAPGTHLAHGFENRSDQPVRFLAVSDRRVGDVCTYPDSGKVLLRRTRQVGVWQDRPPGTAASPPVDAATSIAAARARAATEPVVVLAENARPVHVTGGVEHPIGQGEARFYGTPLSRPAGATAVFVNRDRLPPGSSPSPLHQHEANEEVLLLLSGELGLTQSGADDETRLTPGDLVHWAPGGVAHRISNPGPEDAVYLMIGTDRRWDVTTFPTRGEHHVALLGEVGAVVPADYWDGER